MQVNAPAITRLENCLRQELGHLEPVNLGRSGQAFLSTTLDSWFLQLGTVQTMRLGTRRDPKHFDGGSSLFLMAITLYGHRDVQLHMGHPLGCAAQPDTLASPICITNRPGSIYLGTLAAVEHEVLHHDNDTPRSGDNYVLATGENAKIVVILRCATFRHARGTSGAQIPGPVATFEAVNRVAVKWLASAGLQLPTMQDILAVPMYSGARAPRGKRPAVASATSKDAAVFS